MKKYLFVSAMYGSGSGSYTTSKLLAETFPEYIDHIVGGEWRQSYYDEYKKIIITCQIPYLTLMSKALTKDHVMFTRDDQIDRVYNTATNGLYFYKTHRIKHYIPRIPDMIRFNDEGKEPCLGFYSRPDRIPDSYKMFMEMLFNAPTRLNVCTMGKPIPHLASKMRSYTHTENNLEFFQKITHYVYPKSAKYIDPFPTSLCEAVQARKQLIIPTCFGRNHKDGIDDITDIVPYFDLKKSMGLLSEQHETTDVLDFVHFIPFYMKMIENGFENPVDRDTINDIRSVIP